MAHHAGTSARSDERASVRSLPAGIIAQVVSEASGIVAAHLEVRWTFPGRSGPTPVASCGHRGSLLIGHFVQIAGQAEPTENRSDVRTCIAHDEHHLASRNVACNRALQERRIRFLEDACREIPRMTRREHAEVGFTAPQARRRSSPQRSGTSSVAETARCSARSAATAVVPDFWCQGRRPAPRHPEEQPARFPRTRADRLVCVPRGAIVASRASGGIAANGRRCARPTGAEPSVTEPASS